MKRAAEIKLEQIMLGEPTHFRNLLNDVQAYETLKRMASVNPESITEEELSAAKEAILERWPTITDLDTALESTGPSKREHLRRLITEGKQLPRVRPERSVRETPDQRAARLEEKLTRLKNVAKDKKDKKPK